MKLAFTDHRSALLRLKSGCSGSCRGFVVDSAQCEATICSFTSSLGVCHFSAPTAGGNRRDGFSKDVSTHARYRLFGVIRDLRSRDEALRVRSRPVLYQTRGRYLISQQLQYARTPLRIPWGRSNDCTTRAVDATNTAETASRRTSPAQTAFDHAAPPRTVTSHVRSNFSRRYAHSTNTQTSDNHGHQSG
jgi:hypothetical protein